jgi:SAM-dependent methyltransferase
MTMTASDEPEYLTATRAAYDTVAANYATRLADALDSNPFDRAVLALYADLVRSAASGGRTRVVEIGCGPGRITAHLAGLGLDMLGIDLSPAMIEQARSRHPDLEFRVGDMTAPDLLPGDAAGLVAWYSLIHIPPAEHPAVLTGFRRALAPGGHLLLAFHAGDERRHITDAYGHSALAYDAYRLPPERLEQRAVQAGFRPVARLVREPISTPIGSEKTPQAYLLLRAEGGDDADR